MNTSNCKKRNTTSLLKQITFLFLILFTINLGAQNQIGQTISRQSDAIANSADGSRIAIGNESANNSRGEVQVYELLGNTWMPLGNPIQGDVSGDLFGGAISFSDDGTRIAIGATRNAGAGAQAGHVKVFEFINNNWTQVGLDIDGQHSLTCFGTAVAISGDGQSVVVGNPCFNYDSGLGQVFEWNGGSWVQKGADQTIPSNQATGYFDERLGFAVDISFDGSVIVIGAPYARFNQAGLIIVMDWDGTNWGYTGQIPGGHIEDRLGATVSLSDDGRRVSASASEEGGSILWAPGEIYVWEMQSSMSWTEIFNVAGNYGDHLEQHNLSGDGKRLVIGDYNNFLTPSYVMVYQDYGVNWTLIAQIPGNALGSIGSLVSMSSNGTTIMVNEGVSDVKNYGLGYVTGTIFRDLDQNCSKNGNENYISGKFGVINPGNLLVQTNQNGIWSYSNKLAPGNYTYTVDTSGHWTSSCPVTQNFTVVDPDLIVVLPEIGVSSPLLNAVPTVSSSLGKIRPCTNINYSVQVCNEINATAAMDTAWVLISIDSMFTVLSMDQLYNDLGNNQYQVYLDPLQPGSCQTVRALLAVNCSALLGQGACNTVEVRPVDYCVGVVEPNAYPSIFSPCNTAYDGSDLEVYGYCQNDSIYFEITNNVTPGNDMTCFSPVMIYVDGVLTVIDSVQLNAGQTATFVYPGNGESWHIRVFEHPLNPGTFKEVVTVENCGGYTYPSMINLFAQNDQIDCIDIVCGIAKNSFDPNDKTGYPLGLTQSGYIEANQEMEYVIRFQNTGNDTAILVVIRDTLTQALNPATIKFGASSHDYTYRVLGNNVIEWTFVNIMLPDSNVNEAASHGQVTFTVDQMVDLPSGTVINNRVGIYFDFNAPVITNTTVHTIKYDYSGTDNVTTCGSYTWVDGNTYTASTNAPTITLTSSIGFDSIITLDLTILNIATGTDTQTACGAYMWIDGMTYNTSNNTATHTIVGGGANGCDSIVTLDLTISNNITGTDTQTACGAYTWIDGVTYNTSNNTATQTIVGAGTNGCDSIVTLDLTILNIATGTDTQTACGTYAWIDGMTYNASNTTATHTIVGGGANGCDSIVTLDLTILNNATGTDTQTACGAYTWIDGITYYTSNNTATQTIPGGGTNGCDSIITLDLTINPSPDPAVTVSGGVITANQAGATYQWLDCDNGNQPISGATGQSFSPTVTGNYAVAITLATCTDFSDCSYIVMTNNSELQDSKVAINVYPNPTNGLVNLDFDKIQPEVTVQVIDITGKTVAVHFVENERQMQLELNGVPGIYLLMTKTPNGLTTKKIVLR